MSTSSDHNWPRTEYYHCKGANKPGTLEFSSAHCRDWQRKQVFRIACFIFLFRKMSQETKIKGPRIDFLQLLAWPIYLENKILDELIRNSLSETFFVVSNYESRTACFFANPWLVAYFLLLLIDHFQQLVDHFLLFHSISSQSISVKVG